MHSVDNFNVAVIRNHRSSAWFYHQNLHFLYGHCTENKLFFHGVPGRRSKDSIKTYLTEISCEDIKLDKLARS